VAVHTRYDVSPFGLERRAGGPMSKQRTLTIPLMWHLLRDLRQVVEETLQDFPLDVRNATSMVAAELVSNAIKYGISVPTASSATITLTVTAKQIQIEVSNGVTSESVVQELQARLEQIAGSDSKEQLYMNRLQQLLDDSSQTGKLGLYRIGFEGRFELKCTYAEQVLTVVATRGIP